MNRINFDIPGMHIRVEMDKPDPKKEKEITPTFYDALKGGDPEPKQQVQSGSLKIMGKSVFQITPEVAKEMLEKKEEK